MRQFDWEQLEKIAGVSFRPLLRERVERGTEVAFRPQPPGSKHFEKIADLAQQLETLLSQEAEWPLHYMEDRAPNSALQELRRIAEGQAMFLALRDPVRKGRPNKHDRDSALRRHVVWAWREAGGKGRGYYSGGETKEPNGPLLLFIVELTIQCGSPMSRDAVYDMLRQRGKKKK